MNRTYNYSLVRSLEWAIRAADAAFLAALAGVAVRCLAMQLMTHGFIHCDPHEGNLLSLPDGRVALLDFGPRLGWNPMRPDEAR